MNIKEKLLDLIFPAHCSGCGQIGSYLCQYCWDQVEYYQDHLDLLAEIQNCHLDQVTALTRYQFPINKLIIDLKYRSIKPIGKLLGQMLYFCGQVSQFDLITAVPTSKKRLRQRGFNQAEVIARELARLYSKPYINLLRRIKDPGRQKSAKSRLERSQKQTGCFSATSKLQEIALSSKKIRLLLIDDVVTTAATANECAKVLKSHQISQVNLLAVASDNNTL